MERWFWGGRAWVLVEVDGMSYGGTRKSCKSFHGMPAQPRVKIASPPTVDSNTINQATKSRYLISYRGSVRLNIEIRSGGTAFVYTCFGFI